MSSLIVIRIVPPQPLDPAKFTDYLNPAGLGPLQITAFELSFSDPSVGRNLGTAKYVAASTGPSPTAPLVMPPTPVLKVPGYGGSSPTSGIIQHYDVDAAAPPLSAHFQLDAAATAIIEIPTAAKIENLRLVAQWGSGAGAAPVPVGQLYYDVQLSAGPAPDLELWAPSSLVLVPQVDPWMALSPSAYLHLPAPPSSSKPFSFSLPTDGTPPPFDALLSAVQTILKQDPGASPVVATTSASAGGDTTVKIPATTTGIAAGMSVSGTGIAAHTTVRSIDAGGLVTLSQEIVPPGVASGTSLTFAPNLGALSIEQCRNIAYEIVWSQQPPPPQPPDSVGQMYSNPPNAGPMLSGTTPNQLEADRQQFEASLLSYYTLADTAADRLTGFVDSLSIAIACEERSLASTQAMLDLPANSAAAGGGPVSGHQIILTGVDSVDPPSNFGIPAAYFFGLGALLPMQIGVDQRFQLATGESVERLLSELTSAIDAGTITDAEAFVALAPTKINAAQAARRIAAMNIPPSSTAPLAPLGTRSLQTLGNALSGTKLSFAATGGLTAGMLVSGINIPLNATIASLTATDVTLSAPLLGDVPAGSAIRFAPPYSAGMSALVKSWLAFPPDTSGSLSTQVYLASDDTAKFWPAARSAQPGACLDLVLSALTEGYIVPAPFNTALGNLIITNLLPTATIDALAAVTRAQWIDFFQKNPTWLPPGTGNIQARIEAFIRRAQSFLVIDAGGPIAAFVLATSSLTGSGSTTLQFAESPQIVVGMLASGTGIPPGTTVAGVATAGGITTVTLSAPTTAPIPANSNITFSMNVASASAPDLPQLGAPTQDWLSMCLAAYGPFTLGTGFDPAKLRAAAASVFTDDEHAQQWAFDALTTLDALYQVMKSVAPPPPGTPAFEFSVIEALYARGFTSAQAITVLSGDRFEQALTGTIAFELAAAIYASASAIAPPSPATGAPGGFVPVNPDDTLTNCIPPSCTSPLGPIAYLAELLQLSALSTCDSPVAESVYLPTSSDTPDGDTLPFVTTAGLVAGMAVSGSGIPDDTVVASVAATSVTLSQPMSADVPANSIIAFAPAALQTVLGKRRGPLSDLTASCANLETPLPLIDIVNENLEYLGAAAESTHGVIYDTSQDKLAGHLLCREDPCPRDECAPFCHEPARIFGGLPEFSTPATPVAANSSVEPAVFDILQKDFSACRLPYSQALDVARTYLRHFGSCRVEEMRTFRKCITEFVLDPANEPTGFADHLWRLPVRIDIAIEYLGITPEEYATLFQGTEVSPCGEHPNPVPDPNDPHRRDDPNNPDNGNNPNNPPANPDALAIRNLRLGSPIRGLYGFGGRDDNDNWIDVVTDVPEFLARTCLAYCDFYELWKSGFVEFSNRARQDGAFPECEPCCSDGMVIQFPERRGGRAGTLARLIVFIRLWRKLNESCCFCYSFAQLRDICNVLRLFDASGAINPEFIRQLAAFQMLRDRFCIDLVDKSEKHAAAAVDAERTQLLALWVGPSATKWGWAVRQLCEKVLHHAKIHYRCEQHRPDMVEWLLSKLDALSSLAGFDPASATDNWHGLPTHTLRFAELLAKLAASRFTLAEVLYLFTVDDQHCGAIFPLQDECEASELPLALPADECGFSLWHLRHKLLGTPAPEMAPDAGWRVSVAVDGTVAGDGCAPCDEPRKAVRVETTITEECVDDWDWSRVSKILTDELGFALDDVLDFGRHLFPQLLRKCGFVVDVPATCFVTALLAAKTNAAMWSANADGPLQYDPATEKLWTHVPLADDSLISQLVRLDALNADEQAAVQDLYFQPRASLALFAVLFPDFAHAERHLVEARDECDRWDYFRRHVAQCHQRCRIIACHLAAHMAAVTRQPCPEGESVAMLILRQLFGDENAATSDWERDDGTEPLVTWMPHPNGSGFAALLGLVGTGLVTEYKVDGGGLVWRNLTGALDGFGPLHDQDNAPVPVVLPSLGATITPAQGKYVSVRNGFLVRNAGGAMLGGAQGFEAKWSGALLVDEDGEYEFWAGAPTPHHQKPDCEAVDRFKWRVTLKRGSRTWVLLSHRWAAEDERLAACRHLRRGAYEITVELIRPPFEFATEDQVHALHAGLEVKYAGPDSYGECIPIPRRQLFSMWKDAPLGQGIATQSTSATLFLQRLYTSTFRDIRRTYQRGFKALLFAHRFALAAERNCHGVSELGYMLEEKERFAGAAYFRSGSSFLRHAANFDFNFLPILDDYQPPAADSRTKPSPKRTQAMFDWWERTFDYAVARDDVEARHHRELWHLFAEARATNPTDPVPLLAHLGSDPRMHKLELRYFQDQLAAIYAVSSDDLKDDRWTVRAWHADHWLVALDAHFAAKDSTVARPDLWAADDPSVLLPGETQTGNANLSAFLCDGLLGHGDPRRYDELRRLNDGLRQRGRDALVAYLCNADRVALPWMPGKFATHARELSELLLLDVEAGVCERATRVEEAITAVQCFVRRARLLLEPGWSMTREFAELWDRRFATLDIWQACKRRTLYKEDWVDWADLAKAKGVEAFRFLEDKLRSAKLTAAVPGGTEWWPDSRLPAPEPPPLQRPEPSSIRMLAKEREGLIVLGTPERDARPSWLAAVHSEVRRNPALANAGSKPLPLWIEAAIEVGATFVRIAAAGVPPASSAFQPHTRSATETCVTCCSECGCSHPALVDEYFFWLVPAEIYDPAVPATLSGAAGSGSTTDCQNGFQDDYYDPVQQQSAVWNDADKVPQLLDWPSKPAVRLAWCRIHNGEFQQSRRSIDALAVDPGADADLVFLGRTADSLVFSVTNGIAPPDRLDPADPGYRFDLARDDAVRLPQLLVPKPTSPAFLGSAKLPAYPWMLFVTPGESLFPLSPFAPALAVAQALRSHCRFEAALAWYRSAFNPLASDCTWIDCHAEDRGRNGGLDGNDRRLAVIRSRVPREACCDSTDISCDQARTRSVLLHYLETLVEWGDAVRRHRHSAEAEQDALTIYESAAKILGCMPRTVVLPDPTSVPKVSAFVPQFPPLNPRLINVYEVVRDRLESIRACSNDRRLRDGRRMIETDYFGDASVREGWRNSVVPCDEETEWCFLRSPYRFSFLIQKALEYASRAQELGTALLSAFEKGDAEFLASLHAGQERELLTLGLESRKDAWRDADWQIESLQKTKAMNQTNLQYYSDLKAHGLISGEIAYQSLTIASTFLRGSGNAIEAIAGAMSSAGNYFTGVAGFGGTPLIYYQLPIGQPLSGGFAAAARVLVGLSEIAGSTAGLELTESGWDRRLAEWTHQIDVLTIEIQQIERQILGAQRRRDQMLNDLNIQQRQIEHSREVQDFLRDKFTAHDLYLYLQKETAALHGRTYELAVAAARQAQHAFNVERGQTARRFVPACDWDSLHEGLMAGERLSTALRQMEKAYLDENLREYELTKQISLRLHFPAEFLRLRTTGCCEIEIPEWMFDMDFPGHYMRRIKSVSLTIPCVTGPYTGVHCRLTLLGSATRVDPRLSTPPHECCCLKECCDACDDDARLASEYEACPDDPRIVRQFGAREAVATSNGQNDSGLFTLDFNDPRYLPFEYRGAVSRWRIELAASNNYFDTRTLTDCMMRLGLMAREGGPLLRRAAQAAARDRLPGDGWRLIDVRHEMPDAWQRYRDLAGRDACERQIDLRIERRMFPFVPEGRQIVVGGMAILLGKPEHVHHHRCGCTCDCACSETHECPCPEHRDLARAVVEFRHGDVVCGEAIRFECLANEAWPQFYFGTVKSPIGPIGDKHRGTHVRLRFLQAPEELDQLFLLCRYARTAPHCC
ncbi:hypothetical protein PQR02_35990 [Paraburkholderia sediminicola]|uniref:Uncharacterized protein n=1 Tax=Paraburkholderia rhynchosiae TaxID=487049 RepID=A0ACC7NNH3_9BURK